MSSFRYKPPTSFYFRTKLPKKPYGVSINTFRNPKLDHEANHSRGSIMADEERDMRAQEHLGELEALRHPRERDYYQDHTYYDMWEQRKLEEPNRIQLKDRYGFFSPYYQINPWIWHPGDMVEVTRGEQAGQRGVIIAVIAYKNEIIVQNINIKDITIPASDSHPEQLLQREHPISVRVVKHVDPSTGEICSDVKLIKVRSKKKNNNINNDNDKTTTIGGDEDNDINNNNNNEQLIIEEKRICMPSGVLLPIPPRKDTIVTGDPLRDTPYHTANEQTYKQEEELQILINKKLKAIENGFINKLRHSYMFHSQLEKDNAESMREYQYNVQLQAMNRVIKRINKKADNLSDWWFEELAGYVDKLEADEDRMVRMRERANASLVGEDNNYNNNNNNNNNDNYNNNNDIKERGL